MPGAGVSFWIGAGRGGGAKGAGGAFEGLKQFIIHYHRQSLVGMTYFVIDQKSYK